MSSVADRGGFPVDVQVTEDDLRPAGSPKSPLKEVRVVGIVTAVDMEYLFQGTLEGLFEQPCDRCLETAQVPVDLDVTWYFETGTDSEGELDEETEIEVIEEDDAGQRVRYFEGDDLDLAPHVWEDMILSAPTKYHCSPDCMGLCPTCGANLNDGPCKCGPEEDVSNTGLGALKDMFPELQSGPSED